MCRQVKHTSQASNGMLGLTLFDFSGTHMVIFIAPSLSRFRCHFLTCQGQPRHEGCKEG